MRRARRHYAKGICVAPFDEARPPGSAYADLRFPGVADCYRLTGSTWTRMWVRWDYWNRDPDRLQEAATDANVQLARSHGLTIILTNSGFPTDFNVPGYLTMYRGWVEFLVDRYHPDFFECINEPNYGPIIRPADTASLFATALEAIRTVNRRSTRQTRLMGPATADSSNCAEFTHELLRELRSIGFPVNSPLLCWTHHNYFDTEAGHVRTLKAVHRIVKRSIWLDEGGAHRPSTPQGPPDQRPEARDPHWDRWQAERLTRAFANLNQERYVRLFMNFLPYSDIYFDSGLCYPNPTNQPPTRLAAWRRPAFHTWARG